MNFYTKNLNEIVDMINICLKDTFKGSNSITVSKSMFLACYELLNKNYEKFFLPLNYFFTRDIKKIKESSQEEFIKLIIAVFFWIPSFEFRKYGSNPQDNKEPKIIKENPTKKLFLDKICHLLKELNENHLLDFSYIELLIYFFINFGLIKKQKNNEEGLFALNDHFFLFLGFYLMEKLLIFNDDKVWSSEESISKMLNYFKGERIKYNPILFYYLEKKILSKEYGIFSLAFLIKHIKKDDKNKIKSLLDILINFSSNYSFKTVLFPIINIYKFGFINLKQKSEKEIENDLRVIGIINKYFEIKTSIRDADKPELYLYLGTNKETDFPININDTKEKNLNIFISFCIIPCYSDNTKQILLNCKAHGEIIVSLEKEDKDRYRMIIEIKENEFSKVLRSTKLLNPNEFHSAIIEIKNNALNLKLNEPSPEKFDLPLIQSIFSSSHNKNKISLSSSDEKKYFAGYINFFLLIDNKNESNFDKFLQSKGFPQIEDSNNIIGIFEIARPNGEIKKIQKYSFERESKFYYSIEHLKETSTDQNYHIVSYNNFYQNIFYDLPVDFLNLCLEYLYQVMIIVISRNNILLAKEYL